MQELLDLIGSLPEKTELQARVIESVDCDKYVREKVEYFVEPEEKITAYILVPKNVPEKLPVIFCHHQHAGEFTIGKSEVVGLCGNPDQAYASELAELGFITFAPDSIGFEERNWSGTEKTEYFEMATRLVQGKTLMAKVLHDISAGIDYLESRPEVDEDRIGFIGHSYGGRMAIWAPVFDSRIKVSVSNCGCVPYRLSLTHDTGLQPELCVPGIMQHLDIDDLVKQIAPRPLLISATADDKWSRGAKEIYEAANDCFGENALELKLYEGNHAFTKEMRNYSYSFLGKHLLR